MDLKAQLQQLFERYEADLGDYACFYERDRWVIFTVLLLKTRLILSGKFENFCYLHL